MPKNQISSQSDLLSTDRLKEKKSFTAGLFLVLTLFLFLAIQIRRAWLSDDIFITFRTVDNFLNGYGLVWNLGERVQTYTHPLWMFLLSTAALVTNELEYTTIILSILITLASIILIWRILAVSRLSALFVTIVLIFSNAFIDYSTSGLENPISHLLLIVFLAIYYTQQTALKKVFWLSLISSLIALNRLDLFLITIPIIITAALELRHWKVIIPLLLGQLPLVLWEAFSVIYYGFPFPNTAYAKLNTGIPGIELISQGITYFRESLNVDPITLVVIACGVILPFITAHKNSRPVAIGIILYLLYITKIGGDFMSGRFLSAPFLCSLMIIARYDLTLIKPYAIATLFATPIFLGLLSPTPTLNFWETDLTPRQLSAMVNDQKIANERQYYAWSTGLTRLDRQSHRPNHPYALAGIAARKNGEKVVRRTTVGMFGYYAGPDVKIIDELALGDAFLARLPAKREDQWRIGHFRRTIPAGYEETRLTGENVIMDKNLAQFYDRLNTIISDRFFNTNRLYAIWNMNTGQYDDLIDFETYRYPKLILVTADQVSVPKPEGTAWDDLGNVIFHESGLEIDLAGRQNPAKIEFSLDQNNAYQIDYMSGGKTVGQMIIQKGKDNPGLHVICLETPERARLKSFDRIRIFTIRGDNHYSLGHIRPGEC